MTTHSHGRKLYSCVLTGVLAACTSALAYAQSYPSKPIELVVHTSAGSGGDVISRQMAEIVRKEKFLPQPFLVVNKTGGSGVVGLSYFKTKRGDPHAKIGRASCRERV